MAQTLSDLAETLKNLRDKYIARDGEIILGRAYPDLEKLSSQMYNMLAGRQGIIELTPEEIEAFSESN